MEEETKVNKPTRNKKMLVAVTIFTLAAFNIVQLYIIRERDSNADDAGNAHRQELEMVYGRLGELSESLEERISLLRQYGGRVDSLIDLQHQLEEERYALRYSGNLANKRYEAIRSKVADYEALLDAKDHEIMLLDSAYRMLAKSNDTLVAQQEKMESLLAQLELEKEELEARLREASALRVSQFQIEGGYLEGGYRPSPNNTFKASKMREVRITVKLSPNMLAQAGDKVMYMTMQDPRSTIVAALTDGGDAASFFHNGSRVTYATKTEFRYEPGPKGQEVVLIYRQSKDFVPGKYAIAIYCDNTVETASFFVK